MRADEEEKKRGCDTLWLQEEGLNGSRSTLEKSRKMRELAEWDIFECGGEETYIV